MSLKSELMEIHGIGEQKAEEILDVVGEPNDAVARNIQQAVDYYEEGQYEYAGKFLRRAASEL